MKKITYFFIILTFFSCSIKVEFFILNDSRDNFVVQYEYHNKNEFNGILSNPTIYEKNWISELKIKDNKPKVDTIEKVVYQVLKPNEAIKIAMVTNYSPDSKYKRVELIENLKSLRIKTVEKNIIIKEKKELLIDKFKRKNNHQYIYTIK